MSTMAYLGFIGQIDEVVLRQEGEVGRLEAACARQWQELVETRREKRMYEIVHERVASQRIAAALRRAKPKSTISCNGSASSRDARPSHDVNRYFARWPISTSTATLRSTGRRATGPDEVGRLIVRRRIASVSGAPAGRSGIFCSAGGAFRSERGEGKSRPPLPSFSRSSRLSSACRAVPALRICPDRCQSRIAGAAPGRDGHAMLPELQDALRQTVLLGFKADDLQDQDVARKGPRRQ